MCLQILEKYMAGRYSTDHPDEPLDCSLPQYSCSPAEKQLLRTCMNAATSAGMALGLQGATTGLLGTAPPLPQEVLTLYHRISHCPSQSADGISLANHHQCHSQRNGTSSGCIALLPRWRCGVQPWHTCALASLGKQPRRPSMLATSCWPQLSSTDHPTPSTRSSTQVHPGLAYPVHPACLLHSHKREQCTAFIRLYCACSHTTAGQQPRV